MTGGFPDDGRPPVAFRLSFRLTRTPPLWLVSEPDRDPGCESEATVSVWQPEKRILAEPDQLGTVTVQTGRLIGDPENSVGGNPELGFVAEDAPLLLLSSLEEPTVVPKVLFLCVEEITGRRYTRARDQWIARMPTAEEAAILELPTGAAVLHLLHTARDDNGDILEISESIWPADHVVVIDDYDIEQEPEQPTDPGEI